MLKSILSIGAAIAMLVSTPAIAHQQGFIYIPPVHEHAHTNIEPHFNVGEPPRLNYQSRREYHGWHLDGHWAGVGRAPGNARWIGRYVWFNGITYMGCYSFPTVDDYSNRIGWVTGCPIGDGEWRFAD